MLKIEVEFLRVIRAILKTLQMSWKAMMSTRSIRLAMVEIVGKNGSPKRIQSFWRSKDDFESA